MQHIPQQSKALGRYFNKDILRKVLQKDQLRWKHSPLLCFCAFHQVQNLIFYTLHSIYTFLHSDISQATFPSLFWSILPPPPFLTECLSSAWSMLQFLRKIYLPNFISFLFSHFPHWNLKSPYKSNPLIGLKMRILYSSLITMKSLKYPKFIFSYSMSISSANLVDSTLEILPIFISNLLLSSTTNTRTKGNVI